MALSHPIQQVRTLTANNPPANGTLLEGQLSVEFNPPRIWAGGPGGTTNVLLAAAGIAEPTGTAGQVFGRQIATPNSWGLALPLGGGTMNGGLTLDPTAQATAGVNGAATRQYVLDQVASMQLFIDTWNATTNTPSLNAYAAGTAPFTAPPVNGAYFIASVGAVVGVITGHAIPGLTAAVNPGDMIIWRGAPTNAFERIAGGGMTQGEADLRYLQLAGGTMAAGALLTMGAGYVPAAGTLQVATAASVAGAITAGAVTSIGIGIGLTSTQTPLTTTGTLSLANTAVSPGTYQGLTVDQQGRVTGAVTIFPIDSGTY